MKVRAHTVILISSLLSTIVILLLFHLYLTPEMQSAAAGLSPEQYLGTPEVPDMMTGADYNSYRANLELLKIPPIDEWYLRIRILDWIFPLVYGLFLGALLWRFRRWFILFPAIASGADYIENLILTLGPVHGPLSLHAFHALQILGTLKFAGIIISIALTAAAYIFRMIRNRRRHRTEISQAK